MAPPRRFPLLLGLQVFCSALLVATPAVAVDCGSDPVANTIGFHCSPLASECHITGAELPNGCALDFGNRRVTLEGVFDLRAAKKPAAALRVKAGRIDVDARIDATSRDNKAGGIIELVATDAVVITGTSDLDVSGNSGGLIRIRAGGLVSIGESTSLRAVGLETSSTGNSADGGSIDIDADTSCTLRGPIALRGGPGGGGGSLKVQADTDLVVTQPIDATGGESDGGTVDLTAGDHVRLESTIDVGSPTNGGGGEITVRAGADTIGGVAVGGTLTVAGNLLADGSSFEGSGADGGAIELYASGALTVTGTLHAVGGFPDGTGGSIKLDSSDTVPGRITPLDGDLTLGGTIDVHGPNVGTGNDTGNGGDIDIYVGRDGRIAGAMDLSGSFGGGGLVVEVGRALTFDAAVNAAGTVGGASGGSVSIDAGRASASTPSLAIGRTLDVSAIDGPAGSVTLTGCDLTLAPGLLVTAKTGQANAAPRIDLVTASTMVVGTGGAYVAEPRGRVTLVHPATIAPQFGGNVTFVPPAIHVNDPARFPACAVCGDGIVQTGEPCDKGAAADGACCNDTCSARTCPTVTPTPTVTVTSTLPTRSPTPRRSRTPTPTRTPIVAPSGDATPGLPLLEPRTVLGCERAIAKASSTLVLAVGKTLESCALDAFKCVQTKPVGDERTLCLANAGRRCDTQLAKLDPTHERFRSQFIDACGGDPPVVPIELLRSTDVLGYALLRAPCFGIDPTSPDIVLGCLQILGPCEVERALGMGIPRIGDLLALITTDAEHGTCLPAPLGNADGLAGSAVTAETVRCQRAVAGSGRKLLTRQLSVARACVDALLKCRLSGKPRAACTKVGTACQRKLATLDHPTSGARAKMLAAIRGACADLPADVLREATGIGYAAIDDRCRALGADPATDRDAMARCVTRAYACAGSAIVRETLPLVDGELARLGMALGNDAFCAPATPIPTSTPSPATTPSPGPPPTPGATATAAPHCPDGVVDAGEQCDFGDTIAGDGCDAQCRYEVLVPGGGSATTDCIAEWAAIVPSDSPALGSDGLPSGTLRCTDGDPSCDADGVVDDRCIFRVALCLQNADPRLPGCVAAAGIAKFVLESPRPNASDAGDAMNALALIDAFARVSPVTAGGHSGNTLLFDPPLVLQAPDTCTDAALITVERRALGERSEKLRIATTAVSAADPHDVEDSDTLVLTCAAPAAPTPPP